MLKIAPTTPVFVQPVGPINTTATTTAGLTAVKTSPSTASSSALALDPSLTLTFNALGWYAIEIWLPVFEAGSGAGGFQFTFLGSGTADFALTTTWTATWFDTAFNSQSATSSPSTTVSSGAISTTANAPSWFLAKGVIQIKIIGTAGVQWAQASTLGSNPTTLLAGAYVIATKIG